MSQDLPYRQCVGICLFNSDGLVFVGERIDNPGAWQMPQGGIDDGETFEEAAYRELLEETGTDKAKIIATSEDIHAYDLPDHLIGKLWQGKYRGQEQRWVAMKFLGEDKDVTLYHGVHPEFSKWKWVELEQICDLIVPFKRETYKKVIDEFKDLREGL